MMKDFVLVLMGLLCWQCHAPQYSGKLREALEAAGENRGELERVLAHYAGEAEDSLKWQAACFLIENMPGHYTAGGKMLDSLRKRLDRDTASYFARKAMDVMLSAMPELDEREARREDVRHVTANYLIRHIDTCFALRERYPWYEEVPLEDFFRYVLPYRIGNERLDEWRAEVTPYLPEKYRISDDIRYSMEEARNYLEVPYTADLWFEDSLLNRIYGNIAGECRYLYLKELLRDRLAGIPAAVDYFPHYPNRNGLHYWLTGIYARKRMPYIEGAARSKPAKVFRETFERHALPEARKGEMVPELFRNPFVADVTDEYLYAVDIAVPAAFRVKGRPRQAYLCVFNNLDWQPTAVGTWQDGTAKFEEVGKGIVYLPVYYEGQRMRAFNYPFVLDAVGRVAFLEPDAGDTLRLRLERKYPYDEVQYVYSHVLCGAAIEVSEDGREGSFEEVGYFPEKNHYYLSLSLPDSLPARRYWQVRAHSRACMAEVRFYDAGG